METKSIFVSKTFWFNLVALLIAALGLFSPETLTGLGVTGTTQTKFLTIIGTITGLGNIVLRFFTTKQIK